MCVYMCVCLCVCVCVHVLWWEGGCLNPKTRTIGIKHTHNSLHTMFTRKSSHLFHVSVHLQSVHANGVATEPRSAAKRGHKPGKKVVGKAGKEGSRRGPSNTGTDLIRPYCSTLECIARILLNITKTLSGDWSHIKKMSITIIEIRTTFVEYNTISICMSVLVTKLSPRDRLYTTYTYCFVIKHTPLTKQACGEGSVICLRWHVHPSFRSASRLHVRRHTGSSLLWRPIQDLPRQGLHAACPEDQQHPPPSPPELPAAAGQRGREQPSLVGRQAHLLQAAGGLPTPLRRLHGVVWEGVGGDSRPGGGGEGSIGPSGATASAPILHWYRPDGSKCKWPFMMIIHHDNDDNVLLLLLVAVVLSLTYYCILFFY